MPLDFPNDPDNSQTYINYVWDDVASAWIASGSKNGLSQRIQGVDASKMSATTNQLVSGNNTFTGTTSFTTSNTFNSVQTFNSDITVAPVNIGSVVTITRTLALSTTSVTVFSGNDNLLPTGTYMMSAYTNAGYPLWNYTYVGLMQWFQTLTNSTAGTGLVNTHEMGHSTENFRVYFKVLRAVATSPGTQAFQIWASGNISSRDYVFKFRRIG